MAGRREEVECEQAEAARQFERGEIVRESADDLVGEQRAAVAVEAAAGGIGFEAAAVDAVFEQHFSELPGVAQAEVETLAGDRVQRLRGVADPHFAAPDQRFTHAQGERETAARAGVAECHALAELLLQCGGEGVVVERQNGIGLVRRQGEYDRVFVAERQQGKRAVRREAFPGTLVVAGLRGDFGDHGVLAVVADPDRRVVAGGAFGVHQHLCADGAQGAVLA